jgi:hypothetical protein
VGGPKFGPKHRSISLDVPDSMMGRVLSLENPTQLHGTVLAETDPGDFQDRGSSPFVQ